MQAHDVKVEKFGQFEVRGNGIEVLIAVAIAALKWSSADAEKFAGAACKRHPELNGCSYEYEKLPDDAQTYRPTTVERIYFSWRREIRLPEPRERVEADFAALCLGATANGQRPRRQAAQIIAHGCSAGIPAAA